jgi:tRNA pseudouridine55 synthase
MHGILLLNKPTGIPARPLLNSLLKKLTKQKAGWCGTLDPLATGMLPICFGDATKIISSIVSGKKQYTACAVLGITTDSGDSDGRVLNTQNIITPPTRSDMEQLLKSFVGSVNQIPPMVSAIKHEGVPLYKLARAGKTVQRASRTCEIESIDLIDLTPNTFTIRVICGKGTYIRTLVEDIGQAIGCGAHVSALHRNWVAPFAAYEMISPEELTNVERFNAHLLPIQSALPHMKTLTLNSEEASHFKQGRQWVVKNLKDNRYMIYSPNNTLLGFAAVEDGMFKPKKVLNSSQ